MKTLLALLVLIVLLAGCGHLQVVRPDGSTVNFDGVFPIYPSVLKK